MRRKTSRSLFHLTVLGAIALLLYLNRPSSNKSFPWTRIRYRSASAVPESRGVCPGLQKSTKPALVVSRVTADGDPSWLHGLSSSYHLCIYTVDAPDPRATTLQVPANRGHEAMAYLTFLIDNYEHIPAAGAVFVHGSRFAWHNDHPIYDNAALLSALNVPAALQQDGYHNLRCDWSISTCPPSAAPQGSLENTLRSVLEPWSARAASDTALPRALAVLFGDHNRETFVQAKLGRNDAVRAQCCAQFVVAREKIHRHSKEEYVALRQWLLDGMGRPSRRGAAPADDRVAGRILSYIWHILFLGYADGNHPLTSGVDLQQLNARACPSAEACYCRLYGRCNLRCLSPGSCVDEYSLPKGLKLPADWEETHRYA
ncbi:DUF3431 domain-containing protein [Aspergillus clavatus NRRL 1]|uniref:Uncharacterized protein n=1 Tax=Aspergillus clavatus (strain ATCC 1007 / CBS 513.65 / DSM 816 / NCTC 3887 / NRRL 1 / QM 1276 / 107) TaxID=344612 RepID=A1CGI6_ASPCL|nr:uncharacterized protein ACLA_067020 [Aspergillus clavatus NRRL 1]EAW11066.1 conserved hypothetical protein [Aspergillus clavatus NRRL 1]